MEVEYREFETFRDQINKIVLIDSPVENHAITSLNATRPESELRLYNNIYQENLENEFKDMQDRIMNEQIPILTRLLNESSFDDGYESMAEKHYEMLYEKYGILAETILQNIFLEHMYDNKYLLKHLLFIVANLGKEKRTNLEIIPLAGISNPDIEIQDLSIKCFESWEDKRHIPTLEKKKKETSIIWFKQYISEVIEMLKEG